VEDQYLNIARLNARREKHYVMNERLKKSLTKRIFWPLVECKSFHGKEPYAGINYLRIVENAPVLGDLFKRLLDAQRRSVGPVRSHGFHHVSYGQNPRLRHDLITLQPLRISRTIQSFMMLQNDLGNGPR
jgi:hypothetical protein